MDKIEKILHGSTLAQLFDNFVGPMGILLHVVGFMVFEGARYHLNHLGHEDCGRS